MRSICIIPARYGSSRFPAKPLVKVLGQPMIQRVYERAAQVGAFDRVVVATDDERIYDAVKAFGGEVVMTAESHQSGTDRCLEALEKQNETYDVVVNIQGDEPFVSVKQMQLILSCFKDEHVKIATLIKPIEALEELNDPNRPKVIFTNDHYAIYFSRHTIPYCRDKSQEEALSQQQFYKHIGMYAYTAEALKTITQLSVSRLEKSEGLEQLRWIENGYRIKVAITEEESYCIDTPEDLKQIEERFQS